MKKIKIVFKFLIKVPFYLFAGLLVLATVYVICYWIAFLFVIPFKALMELI